MSVKQKRSVDAALAASNNQTGIFSKSEVLNIAAGVGLSKPMWFFKEAAKLVAISSILPWLYQVVQMPASPVAVIQSQPEPVAASAAKVLTQ